MNGLLTALAKTSSPNPLVETIMLDLLDDVLAGEYMRGPVTIHLAGSGVAAFDRPMINHNWPELAERLHYAPIDVGVLKRSWQMWAGQPISTDDANKTHRAMADVEGHLREARLFRDEFRAAVSS